MRGIPGHSGTCRGAPETGPARSGPRQKGPQRRAHMGVRVTDKSEGERIFPGGRVAARQTARRRLSGNGACSAPEEIVLVRVRPERRRGFELGRGRGLRVRAQGRRCPPHARRPPRRGHRVGGRSRHPCGGRVLGQVQVAVVLGSQKTSESIAGRVSIEKSLRLSETIPNPAVLSVPADDLPQRIANRPAHAHTVKLPFMMLDATHIGRTAPGRFRRRASRPGGCGCLPPAAGHFETGRVHFLPHIGEG